MALALSSSAFSHGQRIPHQFTKEGANSSPPLEWRGAPPNTQSFALIVEDPDAPRGTFRHWAAYDISPTEQRLESGAGSDERRAAFKMAVNDFGNRRYDGPLPPPGHGVHHYHFRLLALDVPQLDLPREAKVEHVLEAARAHALEEAEIVGTFER